MTKGTTKSLTLEAGHLYPMKAFDFVPTGQETTISISSAADLVKFAQDYDNGDYEAKVPVVKLTSDISGFTAAQKDAFNATGGIGAADKKFHGTFDGDGHTIADLAVAVPLFSHVGPTGIVENVELTSTCSLTYSAAISADTNLGAIAGYSEGIITNCVNRGAVTCNSTSRTAGVLKIGGVLGRQNASGTISNCINHGAVTCTAPGLPDIYMGGIVGTVERPASGELALIENCVNHGDVKNGVDSGEPAQPCILHMGGVVGWIYSSSSSPDMTITGLVNTGNVTKTQNSEKHNGTPVLIGGIVGGIHGAAISGSCGKIVIKNSHVINCSIQNGDFNNANPFDQAAHVGGFVGLARGESADDIRFVDSYVNNVEVISYRAYAGGFASFAQGTSIESCNVLASAVKGSLAQLRRGGGLVGYARGNDSLKRCTVTLTKDSTYSLYGASDSNNDVFIGGIVGCTAYTNTIELCKVYVSLMYAEKYSSVAYGWILGSEGGTTTIKDCGLGGTYGNTTAEFTLDNNNKSAHYFDNHICGSGSPTKTGNYYWDGTNAPSTKKTVTISIADYAAANGWSNSNGYNIIANGVSMTSSDNGGANHNGIFFSPGNWHYYQARGGGLTISVPIGYSLVSGTFTYTKKNTDDILLLGSTQINSGDKYDLEGSSAFFTVGNTGNKTNGQARFTDIVIEYE